MALYLLLSLLILLVLLSLGLLFFLFFKELKKKETNGLKLEEIEEILKAQQEEINKKNKEDLSHIKTDLSDSKYFLSSEIDKIRKDQKDDMTLFFSNQVKMNENLSSFRLSSQDAMGKEFDRIRISNENSQKILSDKMDALISQISKDMEKIREENNKKLDEMRTTVDEKLQTTLEARISRSFMEVKENLERLHTSLGSLNELTGDVKNINRIFSNVKTRGIWGEVQAEAILNDILTPTQFVKDYSPRSNRERVEFAIRLPGKVKGSEVFLPIDSKFPLADYEAYKDALETLDEKEIEKAIKALKKRISTEAHDINTKYIVPPNTTDFALLFVPSESLFAELQAFEGFVSELQNKERIVLVGPNNFASLLNSLALGFKTLQIEEYTSRIWHTFENLKAQFVTLSKSIDDSKSAVENAGKKLEMAQERKEKINSYLLNIERLGEIKEAEVKIRSVEEE